MGEEMKVEIVSREIIKPSCPTPPNLKTQNLSLFDYFAPNSYISALLFYPNKNHEKTDNISRCLKSSLTKTLTRFYPFSGRINNRTLIECTDEGAIFIETRVNGVMSLALEESDYSIRKKYLLCGNDPEDSEIKDYLLQVQANFFECGGLVIGLSMSHKVADGATMSTFIKAWSATALNSYDDVGFADFSIASILPALNVPVSLPQVDFVLESNFVEKRYVFDTSKISLLKEKATSEGVKDPTRVECVTSFLWKSIIAASGITSSNLIQLVNFRTRSRPALPLDSVGNMVVASIISSQDHTKTNLNDLIMHMRKSLHDISKIAENGFKTEEVLSSFFGMAKKVADLTIRDDTYYCSSWCRFSFYEADFGWGKPTWACPVMGLRKNDFILLDTKDGVGIEAWCVLPEQDIALLEQDEDFLTFASI